MTSRTLAALALAGTLALAGCGGDPEPKVADPAPSASTSAPTASASPTASETADTQQAYRDFIESYVDAISRSLSTGDPSEWLAMSSPQCSNCKVIAENVRNAFANGGRVNGARWELDSAKFDSTGALGEVWLVDIRSDREVWVDRSGQRIKTVPAGINYLTFAVAGEPNDLELRQLEFRKS